MATTAYFTDLDEDTLSVYGMTVDADEIMDDKSPHVSEAVFLEFDDDQDTVSLYFDKVSAIHLAESLLKCVRRMGQNKREDEYVNIYDLGKDTFSMFWTHIDPNIIEAEEGPRVNQALFVEAESGPYTVVHYYDVDTVVRIAMGILEQALSLKEDDSQ